MPLLLSVFEIPQCHLQNFDSLSAYYSLHQWLKFDVPQRQWNFFDYRRFDKTLIKVKLGA